MIRGRKREASSGFVMTKSGRKRRLLIALFLSALICLMGVCMLLASCGSGKGDAITDIRQLDGQAIGVMTGSSFDVHTDNLIQNADKKYYEGDLSPQGAGGGELCGRLLQDRPRREIAG